MTSTPTRSSYTLALEIVPTEPLTHGAGVTGNEQILHTIEVVVPDGTDGWEEIDVPCVSGASFKAALREWAVADYFERAGVSEGSVSLDVLRLLVKGGRQDRGRQTVGLEEIRRLRTLCPVLAVFGAMDGGIPLRAELQCSHVMPWAEELVSAGLLPREVRPLSVVAERATDADGGVIALYPGTPPIRLHQARSTVTGYRHDLAGGRFAPMLAGEARAAIEENRDALAVTREAGQPVARDERRRANESMPHSAQCIRAGTPLVAIVRLHDATELEFACLGLAVTRWIASGAHLGGGATRGYGACRVRVAGALRHEPGAALAALGTALSLGDAFGAGEVARRYDAHVRERAEEIRTWAAGT